MVSKYISRLNIMFFIYICFFPFYSIGQGKQALSLQDLAFWPEVMMNEINNKISNNGEYVAYVIRTAKDQASLTVQSIKGTWKKEFNNSFGPVFSENSRYLIFNKSDQKLEFINLETKDTQEIDSVALWRTDAARNYLAYLTRDSNLVIKNLKTSKSTHLGKASMFLFSEGGQRLVFQTTQGTETSVSVYDLKREVNTTVYTGHLTAHQVTFDRSGNQLAFIVKKAKEIAEIMYWNSNLHFAKPVCKQEDIQNFVHNLNMKISDSFLSFHGSGETLVFKTRTVPEISDIQNATEASVSVDIWNYKSSKLYPEAITASGSNNECYFAYHLKDEIIFKIAEPNDEVRLNDNFALLTEHLSGSSIKDRQNPQRWLMSLKSGTKTMITDHQIIGELELSPKEKFVTYYDADREGYSVYSVQKKQTVSFAGQIADSLRVSKEHFFYKEPAPTYGIGGWAAEDSRVFIYGQYDIWSLNPTDSRDIICLTHGEGKKQGIVLRFVGADFESSQFLPDNGRPHLLLSAFNTINKNNGFYDLKLGLRNSLQKKYMGSELICFKGYPAYFSSSMLRPVRAKDKNLFLIAKMSAQSAPNLYITADGQSFNRITYIEPHKNFNWYTSKLERWRLKTDSFDREALIFFPENFSPQKKYPIILNFYESSSTTLNEYLRPNYSIANINIPYFVSNGYVVVVPDIYFNFGATGQAAFESIKSVVEHLKSTVTWIDTANIGLQGHSYGGYEVNSIIVRTNAFKAACASAGVSDMISAYGGLRNNRSSNQAYFEKGQGRMATTLWDNQAAYIENSPVLKADKVNTPLLIMSNKGDEIVSFSQGVEFFNALRRNNKRVWMLQYDKGSHGLYREPEQKDFTIRLKQFFDYYLKNANPPNWMTNADQLFIKNHYNRGLDLDKSSVN